MNLRFGESLPPGNNHAVNVLLELMDHTIRYEKDKDTEIEEARWEAAGATEMVKAEAEAAIESAKAETEAAFAMAKKNAEAWRKLEEEYKKQVKRLEIKLAAGEGGMEAVALSRSKSRLREKRAGFQKTTSNLSTVVSIENKDAYRSKLVKYPKTSSNLSELVSPGKDDDGGVNRQKSTGATTTSSKRQSNQVFDHKRTSAAPHGMYSRHLRLFSCTDCFLTDKLFADFGTLMDSQLSQSIQHREDALAGAARQKWEAERRRRGHTGYTCSPESPEDMTAGLGFELYDPELAHDDWKHELPPPPLVVLETATGGKKEVDIDEDNDDGGDDRVDIEGGGYLMKPKKGDGIGKRTKTFFGMNRKKSISPAPEELDWNYSTSSSDTDDTGDDKHGSHNLANALFGMTSFATTIASPVPGMEQALCPTRTGLQIPQIPAFRPKNKRSATNLFGLVPDYKAGVKEKNAAKVGKTERSQQLKAPIADYESGGQRSLLLPERRAYSEAPKSPENVPSSMYGQRVKGDAVPSIGVNKYMNHTSKKRAPGRSTDQSGRKFSLAALSTGQGVPQGSIQGPPRRYYGSVKKRGPSQKLLETRSISSLRNEYDTTHDARGDDKTPAGGYFTSLARPKNLPETRSASSLHQAYNTRKGTDDDDKTPTASHFTTNRHHSYSDDEEDDNKSTYGKSNSCLTLDEQSGIISAASRAPDFGAMASGIEVEQHEREEARLNALAALTGAPQHGGQFEQRAASGAYSKMLPRGPSTDRVLDPRLVRKPSPVIFEGKAAYRDNISEKSPPGRPQTVMAKPVKFPGEVKEERAAAEDAPRHALWRAPGHKYVDEEATWGKPRKLSDPFITTESASEARMNGSLSSSPPLTARKIPELLPSSLAQTVEAASVKSPEELKGERDAAEADSRRTLWRASGHKFAGDELSWGKQRKLSDPFGPVARPSEGHIGRKFSPSSPHTAIAKPVKSLEELKEERATAEETSRRVLWRASGHKFADSEPSWDKQGKPSGHLALIDTPSYVHQDRLLSPPPPLTARKVPFSLQEHGDPFVFPPRDDSLISRRSARNTRPKLENPKPPTGNNTNRDASELYSEFGTIVPYWARPEVLKTIARRDRQFGKGPAADGDEDDNEGEEGEEEEYEQEEERAPKIGQLFGAVTVINTGTRIESIFGPEDFMRTLHGHPEPVLGGRSRGQAIAGLHVSRATNTVSITGDNRSNVVDGRNTESRGASDSSGEGQHTPDTSNEAIFKGRRPIKGAGDEAAPLLRPIPDSRPVTAIYQGHINGHDNSPPFAPGETLHSSPRMITALHSRAQSPESSGTRGRTNERMTSDRARNEASEPREQGQSSVEQMQVLKHPTDVTKGSHERVASTSSVRDRVQQLQCHSDSPLLVAKHRRDGSSQSRRGRRDESTSSIGSLRSPVNPALDRVQNDLMAGRRGVSRQQRSAHMRNTSGTVLTGDHRPTRFGGADGIEEARSLRKTPILAGAAASHASAPSKQLSGEKKEEKAPTINPALAAARSVAQAAEKKRLEDKLKETERKK